MSSCAHLQPQAWAATSAAGLFRVHGRPPSGAADVPVALGDRVPSQVSTGHALVTLLGLVPTPPRQCQPRELFVSVSQPRSLTILSLPFLCPLLPLDAKSGIFLAWGPHRQGNELSWNRTDSLGENVLFVLA